MDVCENHQPPFSALAIWKSTKISKDESTDNSRQVSRAEDRKTIPTFSCETPSILSYSTTANHCLNNNRQPLLSMLTLTVDRVLLTAGDSQEWMTNADIVDCWKQQCTKQNNMHYSFIIQGSPTIDKSFKCIHRQYRYLI